MHALSRALPLVLTTAVLALAGCTNSADRAGAPTPGQQPVTTAPATPDASDTAGPTPTPTPTALADQLLPTASVPGLNATWHWQDGLTGAAPSTPPDVCAKGSLLDIGATEAIARSYFPPDDSDDHADEQIADFPDATTTATAWAVLASWQAKCAGTTSSPAAPQPGPFASVAVTNGSARWYLVTQKLADEEVSRFTTIGMVRSGNRIALLQMFHTGRAHAYPAGQDPMVGMVTAAAALLG